MKSVERRFKNVEKMHPYWSDIINFNEAIAGQTFCRATIAYWFNRLVDKDDYAAKEKRQVFAHTLSLANVVSRANKDEEGEGENDLFDTLNPDEIKEDKRIPVITIAGFENMSQDAKNQAIKAYINRHHRWIGLNVRLTA